MMRSLSIGERLLEKLNNDPTSYERDYFNTWITDKPMINISEQRQNMIHSIIHNFEEYVEKIPEFARGNFYVDLCAKGDIEPLKEFMVESLEIRYGKDNGLETQQLDDVLKYYIDKHFPKCHLNIFDNAVFTADRSWIDIYCSDHTRVIIER